MCIYIIEILHERSKSCSAEYMYILIGKSTTRQVGFIIIEVVYYKNSDEKKKLNTLRNRGNGRTDGGDEEIQVVRVTQQWPWTRGWKGRWGVTSSYILPGFRQLSLGGPMVVKMRPTAGKRDEGGGRAAFWAPCGGRQTPTAVNYHAASVAPVHHAIYALYIIIIHGDAHLRLFFFPNGFRGAHRDGYIICIYIYILHDTYTRAMYVWPARLSWRSSLHRNLFKNDDAPRTRFLGKQETTMLRARTAYIIYVYSNIIKYYTGGPRTWGVRARECVRVCGARMESDLLFLYEVYCFCPSRRPNTARCADKSERECSVK